MLKAGDGAELGTLGTFGCVWRELNPPAGAGAHWAPPETKASLQSCSERTG